jgi:hypothetical protein
VTTTLPCTSSNAKDGVGRGGAVDDDDESGAAAFSAASPPASESSESGDEAEVEDTFANPGRKAPVADPGLRKKRPSDSNASKLHKRQSQHQVTV